MVAFDDVIDGGADVGVSGSRGSGVGEDSTELGLLNAACVIESSGVSKKLRSNSECASNLTSVISSTIDASGSIIVELMLDESRWNTSMFGVWNSLSLDSCVQIEKVLRWRAA